MDNSRCFKKNDIGINNFRFANILNLNSVSVDNIQSVVKTVKAIRTSLEQSCHNSISWTSMLSQVKAMEQMLHVESSEYINETLTNVDLKTAAEMFLYLNSCPSSWFKYWLPFYADLFQTQSAANIVLTINRILKKNIIGDDMIYNNNKNIFTKITNLLELKYEEIQRLLLPDQVKKRGNLKNFTEKGKHI